VVGVFSFFDSVGQVSAGMLFVITSLSSQGVFCGREATSVDATPGSRDSCSVESSFCDLLEAKLLGLNGVRNLSSGGAFFLRMDHVSSKDVTISSFNKDTLRMRGPVPLYFGEKRILDISVARHS
jgi:hypothetical protein